MYTKGLSPLASFADGASLRKVQRARAGRARPLTYVFLNRTAAVGGPPGAMDDNISIVGLHVRVNGWRRGRVGCRCRLPGLRGQIAFFHVRNVTLQRFRVLDLGCMQFGVIR